MGLSLNVLLLTLQRMLAYGLEVVSLISTSFFWYVFAVKKKKKIPEENKGLFSFLMIQRSFLQPLIVRQDLFHGYLEIFPFAKEALYNKTSFL